VSDIYQRPEIIQAFLNELEEQIQFIEQGIGLLGQESDIPTAIAKISRAAHTLVGSSTAMGAEKIRLLTLEIEALVKDIRNNQFIISGGTIDKFSQYLADLKLIKDNYAKNL